MLVVFGWDGSCTSLSTIVYARSIFVICLFLYLTKDSGLKNLLAINSLDVCVSSAWQLQSVHVPRGDVSPE